MTSIIRFFTLILSSVFLSYAWTQSILDEYTGDSLELPAGLFQEEILKISSSGRIHLLSNRDSQIVEGDYLTFVINGKKIIRALAVKTIEDKAAVKRIKIYDESLISLLRVGRQIELIKGDDSGYKSPRKRSSQSAGLDSEVGGGSVEISDREILSEDELLGGGDFESEFGDEKSSGLKSDNIISFNVGSLPSIDAEDNPTRYFHWNGSWAYQFYNNIWGELIIGQHMTQGFPSESIDSRFNTFSVRFKYTITAPFLSYVQPYIGYQVIRLSSPEAGVQSSDEDLSEDQLAREKNLVDRAEKNTIIFGLTILKRLVPGWFLKAEIGTDLLNAGFAFEF